jgi:tyrosyl-tRNA synthetase
MSVATASARRSRRRGAGSRYRPVAIVVRANLTFNGEAKRLVMAAASAHDTRIDDPMRKVGTGDIKDGHVKLLKAGKKKFFRFDVR